MGSVRASLPFSVWATLPSGEMVFGVLALEEQIKQLQGARDLATLDRIQQFNSYEFLLSPAMKVAINGLRTDGVLVAVQGRAGSLLKRSIANRSSSSTDIVPQPKASKKAKAKAKQTPAAELASIMSEMFGDSD